MEHLYLISNPYPLYKYIIYTQVFRGEGGGIFAIKGELEIKYPVQFLTATGSDLKHIHVEDHGAVEYVLKLNTNFCTKFFYNFFLFQRSKVKGHFKVKGKIVILGV